MNTTNTQGHCLRDLRRGNQTTDCTGSSKPGALTEHIGEQNSQRVRFSRVRPLEKRTFSLMLQAGKDSVTTISGTLVKGLTEPLEANERQVSCTFNCTGQCKEQQSIYEVCAILSFSLLRRLVALVVRHGALCSSPMGTMQMAR